MHTVKEYILQVAPKQVLKIENLIKPLSVIAKSSDVMFYAMVAEDVPSAKKDTLKKNNCYKHVSDEEKCYDAINIYMINLDEHSDHILALNFLGSVVVNRVVWHIFYDYAFDS